MLILYRCRFVRFILGYGINNLKEDVFQYQNALI